eukprot:maker-scaffold_4-snap-gene-7.0-mRNA-1 protein AED:0.01 eAED:0.01 QI:367/1/1/1/0.66/0.5/4/90/628
MMTEGPIVFKDMIRAKTDTSSGDLKLTSEMIEYDNSDEVEKFDKNNIAKVVWVRCGRIAMLQLHFNDGEYERFDGFKYKQFDEVSQFFQEQYGIEIKTEELSTYGYNTGKLKLADNKRVLELKFEGQTVMEAPFHSISQCAVPNKNEVEIQFEDDDTAPKEYESLVQMRILVPNNEDDVDIAEDIQAKIVEKAGISASTGAVLCQLSESIGTFLTPRGKYLIEFYEKAVRMHGKTYNYKIGYQSISKMFLLPGSYGNIFVISLAKPIQQGQQRYPHLVMQLGDKQTSIHINMTEEALKKRFGDSPPISVPDTEGKLSEVVARVFKAFSGKKVFVAGDFLSALGLKFVKCALKAVQGSLYPLNHAFFFIHKPATYLRYEDIQHVEFLRLDTTDNKFFDLEVVSRTGQESQKYQFSNIEKEDYPQLFSYLKKKGISIKNRNIAENSLKLAEDVARMVESQKAQRQHIGGGSDISDDESEEDSDFEAGSDHSGGSGKSSDDSDSDSDHEESKPKKVAKRKKSAAEGSKETAPAKKKAKKKDPKYPKKNLSAYMFFSKEEGKRLRELPENKDLKITDIAKKVGEAWKSISQENKKKYEEEAAKDKERFEKDLKKYVPSEGFDKSGKPIEKAG